MSAKEQVEPIEVVRNVFDTVYHELTAVGSELSEDVQALAGQGNRYYLTVRINEGDVLVRVPLTVGAILLLACLIIKQARWALLFMALVLFARFHLSIEPQEAFTRERVAREDRLGSEHDTDRGNLE